MTPRATARGSTYRALRIFVLFFFACAFLFTLPRVHAETVNYDYTVNFFDGLTYDFDDGTLVSITAYASTTKLGISRPGITLTVGGQYSYVFFWDKWGGYIGYGAESGLYVAGSKYLGAFTETITPPVDAATFAVSAAIGDGFLVGANTWTDVYDNPIYLGFETEYLDGVDPYTLDDIFTPALVTVDNYGYSKGVLDAQAAEFAAEGITVLSLTNILQYGNFAGNTTGWLGYGGTLTYDNGRAKITGDGSYASPFIYRQMGSNMTTSGHFYYMYGELETSQASYVRVLDANAGSGFNVAEKLNPSNNVIYKLSVLDDMTDTSPLWRAIHNPTTANGSVLWVDNLQLFYVGATAVYTKTQIDTALAWSGYLPYNTAYSLPDTTDADFLNLGGTGGCSDGGYCYIMRGAGIGVTLDILDIEDQMQGFTNMYTDDEITDLVSDYPDVQTRWFHIFDEWRAIYGDGLTSVLIGYEGFNPLLFPSGVRDDFKADHADRDYYLELYYDAVAQTPDRWEWYGNYGVDEVLYDDTIGLYPDIAAQAGFTDFYADFTAYEFSGSYEVTPETPDDAWDAFQDLLTPTIKTIAALILIIGAVIFVMFKGGTPLVAAMIAVVLIVFFILVAWLPSWWGLVLGMIAFVLFILPLLKGGSSA